MKINQIWNELESESTFHSGILLRRFSSNILPEVFVALKAPERYRCIAAYINNDIVIDILSFDNLKDITIEFIPDNTNNKKNICVWLAWMSSTIFPIHPSNFCTVNLCANLETQHL